ncbi:aspartate/glutamate racemase family protein [Desulfobaculum bizertense]|uniref:Asp/Glu/hydantoin racemase n=1 Tax=Desulfobaculum bizertense DSM 18034 TaxID=1121442 RepID=A0A1T4VQB3_9BACT|nr:aspartate/glutamate racemase family protein [Desulfobaculum bizertense]UIJ38284.1 aspartate/glutamate racemase family protein [Desulfobaculum bizertense]SKA67137.1 hypothetical protein SAMN02745702_00768 [Desulfobaculum bizertense DSM 18034]
MAKPKVAILHTFLYAVNDMQKFFRDWVPEVEIFNIIDDTLLAEALENKGTTPGIISRYCDYARIAENLGADCILSQCSSMKRASETARNCVNIPVLTLDTPMMEEAVSLGNDIALVCTSNSTVSASTELLTDTANASGKDCKITTYYCDGAYDALLKEGDADKHNAIVLDYVKKAAEKHDVIVMAQGSHYHLRPLLEKHVSIPVLTSPEGGVKQIRKVLGL